MRRWAAIWSVVLGVTLASEAAAAENASVEIAPASWATWAPDGRHLGFATAVASRTYTAGVWDSVDKDVDEVAVTLGREEERYLWWAEDAPVLLAATREPTSATSRDPLRLTWTPEKRFRDWIVNSPPVSVWSGSVSADGTFMVGTGFVPALPPPDGRNHTSYVFDLRTGAASYLEAGGATCADAPNAAWARTGHRLHATVDSACDRSGAFHTAAFDPEAGGSTRLAAPAGCRACWVRPSSPDGRYAVATGGHGFPTSGGYVWGITDTRRNVSVASFDGELSPGAFGWPKPEAAQRALFRISVDAPNSRDDLVEIDLETGATTVIASHVLDLHATIHRDARAALWEEPSGFRYWNSETRTSEPVDPATSALLAEVLVQFADPEIPASMAAWSPDGRRFAFMGRTPDGRYQPHVWDAATNTSQAVIPGGTAELDRHAGLIWSPDGRLLAHLRGHEYAHLDFTDLRVWDSSDDTVTTVSAGPGHSFEGGFGNPGLWAPGRNQLAYIDTSGVPTLRVWSPADAGEAPEKEPDAGPGDDRDQSDAPDRPGSPGAPPAVPANACDPGVDTGWLSIAGTTFACIFSGDVWDDPDLVSAKQRCVTRLTVAFAPFAKLLRAPAYWKRFTALRVRIKAVGASVRKLGYANEARALEDVLDLAQITSPSQIPLVVASTNRVLGSVIGKLSRGSRDAQAVARQLAALKTDVKAFVTALTGAADVADCVRIFHAD